MLYKISRELKLLIFSCILAIVAGIPDINAQILDDSLSISLIKSGIDNIYNLEFPEAEEVYTEINSKYPGHPVNYLFHGILTYWKNYPLIPASSSRQLFESDLRKCIDLSRQEPYSSNHEAESLLANICARGLLLVFYADNGLSMNVIPLVGGTYRNVMKSFDFVHYYPDFYYFTGLYNYYREAYSKIHPVYKSVVSIFPPGDMKRGISELVKSSNLSIFLKAESYAILTWIYTGFERNYLQASFYSGRLISLYPENLYFRTLNIRNLLLLGKYDEAENLIKGSRKDTGNTYYDAQIMIINGILLEKKYKNYSLAKMYYEGGISAISLFGEYGNEFCAYAYFGLSRISEFNGDKTGKKAFRSKGMNLVVFKKVNFD